MFSKTSGQLLREHMQNPRHLDVHAHTRHREMFMRQDCCAHTPQAHLDLSPRATRPVPAERLLHSHATSTLGSLSVRKVICSGEKTAAFSRGEHTWISPLCVHATRLHSHAVSTLGSLSARNKTCSGEKTAAFSRHEHTWISLRAFMRLTALLH